MSQNDAYYVSVLRTHAALKHLEIFGPDDYRTLVVKPLGEEATTRTISLNKAGDIQLIAFNSPPDQRNAERIIDHLELAAGFIESFMMTGFPEKRVLLLFTDPGEDTLGRFLGTHVVAHPQMGTRDLNDTLTHELAHYYLIGSADRGLPPWFSEGGPEFLAANLSAQSGFKSLEDRRRDLNSSLRYCETRLGIKSINKLLERISAQGYQTHIDSPSFFCNYAYGEILFLDLYPTLGDEPFREAWKEIYELSLSEDQVVAEDKIYHAFLSRVAPDKVAEFREIYQRWHGGDFENKS